MTATQAGNPWGMIEGEWYEGAVWFAEVGSGAGRGAAKAVGSEGGGGVVRERITFCAFFSLMKKQLLKKM